MSCGGSAPVAKEERTAAPPSAAAVQEIVADQIATEASWENTEGPALDSKNNLYFCSRGTYKGIVRWNEKEGAQRYLAVATKAGPGKITPQKKVTTIARGFEKDPKIAKGPNDLVVAKNRTIYFTDPNGYDGSAPNGTIYRIDTAGKTSLFSDAITGPNGIILSLDENTLYVSHNVAKSTSKIETWMLNADETNHRYRRHVSVALSPCCELRF